MAEPLKVLLVEDVERDAELVLRELKRSGLICESRRVETEADFRRELGEFSPDIVLSDFAMPHFSGQAALAILRDSGSDIPLIFVSGTIGEDAAVEAMRAGANDYVMKMNLARLGQAVQRELRGAQARRARRVAEHALHQSETNYQDLVEQAADGIFLTDTKGNFLLVNSRYCEMLGYSEDELLLSNVSGTYPDEEREGLAERFGQLREAESRLFERTMRRKDGTSFPVEVSVRYLANGMHQGIARDITERKRAEQKIQRLNRVYAVLSGINALIVRVTEREELYQEACRIAVEAGEFRMAWLGVVDSEGMQLKPVAWYGTGKDYIQLMPVALSEAVPGGRGLPALVVDERKAIVIDDMTQDARVLLRKEALERGFHSLVMLPLVVSEKAVGVLALYASEIGFFDDDEMKLLLELAGDISFALDHIQKTEKLDYLSYFDPLTGLANRSLFHDRLDQYVLDENRAQHKHAVLIVDVDRFKTINDTLGRHAGDELLKQIGERLSRYSREPGRLARITADRFAMVMPKVENEGEVARRTEEKLRACFGEPYRVKNTELRLSAKVGIALFPNDGADAESLFKNAEAAVENAKGTGEKYMFYEHQMNERIAEKLSLENKLRRALEKEEFVLHYQPKVNLGNGKVVGVEALIRWMSPEQGLVPPVQFIPMLEETGMILEAGAWALRRAALDHRLWLERGLSAPRIAVNVSAVQLRQRDFVANVQEAIKPGTTPPGIDLEITESLIVEQVEETVGKLETLRLHGMNIAIDDFGTGYSSLGYLARLPVQSLKIDRSFIITMLKDPAVMTLVSMMISLAHSMKLTVVAEGVDAEEQATALGQLGCDQMQGYLFSKPLPFEEITKLLGRERIAHEGDGKS